MSEVNAVATSTALFVNINMTTSIKCGDKSILTRASVHNWKPLFSSTIDSFNIETEHL